MLQSRPENQAQHIMPKSQLHLVYKQTDLWLRTEGEPDPRRAEKYLKQAYLEIEEYITQDKHFLLSLYPYKVPETAPYIIKRMSVCSMQAGVGPMAGVAGAISEYLGRRLTPYHRQIICNNGGDIYYKTLAEQHFLLSAPGSPFHNIIEICVPPAKTGKGLCTSSGISGHSINMGRAYAVTILATNACLADVWATAVSNQVLTHLDIDRSLEHCINKKGVEGAVVLVDQYLSAWGDITLNRV